MTTSARPALSWLVLSLALSLTGWSAWADTPAAASTTAAGEPETSWGLGVLLAADLRPYQDVDTETTVWPWLQFETSWLRVEGPTADLKLYEQAPLALGLRAQYADTGYEASDSAALAGMVERKSSVWLGAHADFRIPQVQLSADWLVDASGHSKGQQFKLVAERFTTAGSVGVVPRLGLIWQDARYVDYYFGVRASEAQAGRAAYSGKAALSTELGVKLLYRLAPQQSVFMDLSATALGSSIQDSPLVDRNWVSALRLGYVYSF